MPSATIDCWLRLVRLLSKAANDFTTYAHDQISPIDAKTALKLITIGETGGAEMIRRACMQGLCIVNSSGVFAIRSEFDKECFTPSELSSEDSFVKLRDALSDAELLSGHSTPLGSDWTAVDSDNTYKSWIEVNGKGA